MPTHLATGVLTITAGDKFLEGTDTGMAAVAAAAATVTRVKVEVRAEDTARTGAKAGTALAELKPNK